MGAHQGALQLGRRVTERRRHRKCWRPGDQSPGFILFIVIVTLLTALLSTCAQAAEQKRRRVPVVEPEGDVLVQTGWLTYTPVDGVLLLYCVPEGAVTLTCTAYVTTKAGNGVVLISGIQASEAKS